MRLTSATWPQLVAACRQGVGVEVWLAIHVPSRNLVLTSRPWPDGWLPSGVLVYPFLGPTGQGINNFSIELAEDRSSRLGTVSCQVLVTAGQVGSPPDPRLTLLLGLAEQEAFVLGLLRGGVAQTTYERLTLFAGRISGLTLTRGQLSFALVDGVEADHRELETPIGSSVFAGSPTDAHGQAVPLILGTALGLEPVMVAGAATGTLATALPAEAVTTIDLVETGAPFPDSGTLTIDAETLTYSGRRLGVLLNGQAALQLLQPLRNAPVTHAAGGTVLLTNVTYRYLIGTGVPDLEVLAVRDEAGPVLDFTLIPAPPGTPPGTVVLETPSAHTGLQVDVQAIPVPPLPTLLNGGFESGTLDGWTPEPGTTATVVAQEVLDGRYKLELGTIPVGTTQGIWQDIAVEPGRRYVVHLAWRTPLETSANVVPNGAFTQPTLEPWVYTQTQGPPIPVMYTQGMGGERGQVQLTLPPGPPIPPTGPLPNPVQFHVTLTQASVDVLPGVTHTLAAEVWAFAQPPWWIPGAFIPSRQGTLPRVSMFVEVTDAATGVKQALLQLQGYALTTPAPSPGQWMRYLAQGTVAPPGATVTLRLTISGSYWGTLPPISVRAFLLSATPDADENTILQATGLVELGLPSAPAHYTSVQSSGSPNWEALDVGFVAAAPTLRLSLRGQAPMVDARVEYDSVRFLAPGRNPVTLMAAVFARFLPHLALNHASVQAAEARRQSWLFGGYLPDPGRTDQLLVKMAQESWCAVFKDLDGVYQITADDPDVQPVFSLVAARDVIRESLGLTWLGLEQVYTDFYLWYGRVTQATTTVPAGQYAAVLYVTPDASISVNPDLQPLCQQAAMQLRTRKRFDFYADLISDPPTADRLLTRLVQHLAVLPEELTLQATVPALPLALTDRVQVSGGLLGPQPWVGDVRQTTLTVAPTQPGLAVALRLRRAGLRRGVWEEWAYTPLPPTLRVHEPWDMASRLLRETWDEAEPPVEGGGTVFLFAGWIPALLDIYTAPTIMVAALQVREGDPLPATAAFWQTSSAAPAATDLWTPIDTASGGGQGTALGLYANSERFSGLLRASSSTPPSTLWELGIVPGRPVQSLAELPPGLQATSTANIVELLFIGTAYGDIYTWNSDTGEVAQVFTSFGGRVQILRRLPSSPLTLEAWIESPDGLIIMRTTYPSLTWTPYTYTNLTGTRCSAGIPPVYTLDTWHLVATGNEAGDRVDVWNLAPEAAGTATIMQTFLGGVAGAPLQRPGMLCANPGGRSAAHPYCYLGRVSLETTPLLELWGFDDTQEPQWQLLRDYATVPNATYGLDTNQGITAMCISRQSRVLYVATGTPGGTAPFPGARIYHYTPE